MLVVSVFGLVPGQGRTALGVELLVESLAIAALAGVLVARTLPAALRRVGEPRVWLVTRLTLVAAGTVPFLVAGPSLIAGAGGGLYWALAGIVGAFVGTVSNAWVLLVEIQR